MLIPIDPFNAPVHAYRVPWHVDRFTRAHPVVINASGESASFVRVFRDSPCHQQQLHGSVAPNESFALCLCDADLDDVTVTISWFRGAGDDEYVWRFVV